MSQRKKELPRSIAALLAAIIFWPPLAASAWVFLPPLAAFVASVFVSLGMVLTVWPALRALCAPVRVDADPLNVSPLSGPGRNGMGAGRCFLVTFSSADVSPSIRQSGDPSFLSQTRTRTWQPPSDAGRSPLSGSGFNFAASDQALREAGFTLVSLPVSRDRGSW